MFGPSITTEIRDFLRIFERCCVDLAAGDKLCKVFTCQVNELKKFTEVTILKR